MLSIVQSTNRFLRRAIFMVYKGQCPYCGDLFAPYTMMIDRILPSVNKITVDSELQEYLHELGNAGFNLKNPEHLENYMPSCGHCNFSKSNNILSVSQMRYFHHIAFNNTKKINTLIQLYRNYPPEDINKYGYAKDYSNRNSIDDFYTHYSDFVYEFENNSGLVLPRNKTINAKDIAQEITIVSGSLLRQIRNRPEDMLKLTPRQFEEMVCELLDKQGYTVKLTKQTRDGGKDIIVVQNSLLGEFCIYVECKKYDQTNPVGVGLIRQLYGTVIADKATAGLYVTASYYTRDAKEFTETIKHQMSLKDYNDLVYELNKIEI